MADGRDTRAINLLTDAGGIDRLEPGRAIEQMHRQPVERDDDLRRDELWKIGRNRIGAKSPLRDRPRCVTCTVTRNRPRYIMVIEIQVLALARALRIQDA